MKQLQFLAAERVEIPSMHEVMKQSFERRFIRDHRRRRRKGAVVFWQHARKAILHRCFSLLTANKLRRNQHRSLLQPRTLQSHHLCSLQLYKTFITDTVSCPILLNHCTDESDKLATHSIQKNMVSSWGRCGINPLDFPSFQEKKRLCDLQQ